MKPVWTWHAWDALTPDTLYAFLRLRSEIFVVEQNCVFPEMDGIDPLCEHLCGYDQQGALLAYLRLVPPQVKAPQPALGRLVVAQSARGSGLGRLAIHEGLRHCAARYPEQDIFLSAQRHLENFYASMGFKTCSEPYLEDDIWHVNMLRTSG
jgi:ElaA protein